MITTFLIDMILTPIQWILELIEMPVVDPLEIPEGIYSVLRSACQQVGYFLPVKLILSILVFDFAISNFHIIWSIVCKLIGVFRS